MTMEATRGKWVSTGFKIIDENGRTVANSVKSSDDEAAANAYLIVTAVNACKEINPDNPQAVAESIKDMFGALKGILLVAIPANDNSKMTFEEKYIGSFNVLGNRLEDAVEALQKATGR